jgi:hypothetical protein
VYARFVPKPEQTAKQTNVIKDIEQTMEQFTADIEEENRQVIGLVADMMKEHHTHTAKLQGRIELLEQQNREVNDKLLTLTRLEQSRKEAAPAALATAESAPRATVVSAPPPPVSGQEQAARTASVQVAAAQPERGAMNIRDRYANVFQLYDQGKSTDYIAKKLDMNKGEVMLIIQLAKQEGQARA